MKEVVQLIAIALIAAVASACAVTMWYLTGSPLVATIMFIGLVSYGLLKMIKESQGGGK